MEHLAEIEDRAVRDAVAIAQQEYEKLLLRLLPKSDRAALKILNVARRRIISAVKNRPAVETIAAEQQLRSERIALAILEKSFERLRATLRV